MPRLARLFSHQEPIPCHLNWGYVSAQPSPCSALVQSTFINPQLIISRVRFSSSHACITLQASLLGSCLQFRCQKYLSKTETWTLWNHPLRLKNPQWLLLIFGMKSKHRSMTYETPCNAIFARLVSLLSPTTRSCWNSPDWLHTLSLFLWFLLSVFSPLLSLPSQCRLLALWATIGHIFLSPYPVPVGSPTPWPMRTSHCLSHGMLTLVSTHTEPGSQGYAMHLEAPRPSSAHI